MVQKVFFGNTNTVTATAHDIKINEKVALAGIVLLILFFGIYPQPLLNLTNGFVEGILKQASIANLSFK